MQLVLITLIAIKVDAFTALPVAMGTIAIQAAIKFNGRKRMLSCHSPPEKVAGIADRSSE